MMIPWASGILSLCQLFVGQASPIVDMTPATARAALIGPNARYTLLVDGKTATGELVDLTRKVRYRSANPKIAEVSPAGTILAVRNGITSIDLEFESLKRTVAVEVTGAESARVFHFENDIVPILSRYGCNSSGCHGNAEGQNGFKLSVFGFDPPADHAALTKEARGRRLFPAAPEASLLLTKASGAMAHGGGSRIRPGTLEYQTLRDWIAAGAPLGASDAPHVLTVRIEPRERLMAMKGTQQLRVLAKFSDGQERDVTALAKFQTNQEALASVNDEGHVTINTTPGEVAIMASYLGEVAAFRALVPRTEVITNAPKLLESNFIDPLVHARLRKLNILPSGAADDAEYLRRVYLDVIGTLPTVAESRRFLADTKAGKRERLVDALLERPEYADFWSLIWADVLRVDRQALGPKRAYAFFRWIRQSLADDKPFDQFTREVLQAEGPLDDVGPANFYKVAPKSGEAASSLAQIFLGVRIACAECHHHPFDRWSQTDYLGMQAFFTQLSIRKAERGEILEAVGEPVSKHPRTGAPVSAHALGMPHYDASPPGDRREALAKWLVAGDNPWFARNLANRLWAHFLGRGIIDPVDDVRDTNPPSNPELLDALAKRVVDAKFSVKDVIRSITASQAYQRSSRPNTTNAGDEINVSRALFRRLPAEVLLDMVSQTTGVDERFKGMPPGTRAIQLWDSKAPHDFLKLFGRPQRLTACECERNHEPGVAQVLHLLNSRDLQAKLSHDRGTLAKLVEAKANDPELVDEIYLTFFSRLPSDAERTRAVSHLTRRPEQRREAVEDLAWSLMNTLEFVFNH